MPEAVTRRKTLVVFAHPAGDTARVPSYLVALALWANVTARSTLPDTVPASS
jgi:hypothetical protein